MNKFELQKLAFLLDMLPEEHIAKNRYISRWSKTALLTRDKTAYPFISGLFHPEAREAVFCAQPCRFRLPGNNSLRTFDATVFVLIGFSLLSNSGIRKEWEKRFKTTDFSDENYLQDVHFLDIRVFMKYFLITDKTITIHTEKLHPDQHFALCYAAYVLASRQLYKNNNEIYTFMKTRVFNKREYKESDRQTRNFIMC